MKILYLYQYFTTPEGSYSTRVYEFTKRWVEKGHEVTVVTGVYYKSDIRTTKFIEKRLIDGIEVIIVNVLFSNKNPVWRRIYSFIIFSLIAIYYSLFYRYHILIASSGPLTITIPALFAKWIRRKKIVIEIRDLWPDAPVKLKVIKNKFLIWVLYKFEKLVYCNASLIVALSPGMQNEIRKKCPSKRVISITNSANLNLFSRNNKEVENQYKKKYGDYVIYAGNIGEVNNSILLYELAKEFKRKGIDIFVILVGNGQLKEKLKEFSKQNHLLIVLDAVPKTELVNLIKPAIASLVPLKNLSVLDTSSPNKLFESMAAGVPVIQTTQGWIKDMLEKTKAGFTVPADDVESLSEKILLLKRNEKLRKQMGENARLYAIKNFDKNKLSVKYLEELEKLI